MSGGNLLKAQAKIFEEYQDIVTIKDVRKMLKIGRALAYELVRSGKIPSMKIGRSFRIQKSKVIEYLQQEEEEGNDRKFATKEQ